ncbi:MAG: hypothetical protein BMS9Abin12_1808 [Acidimicrobiia bacterium]|nr:MAG: hypothetical protein BMS9Abin12_1808 [Acidimicrobiia bacterium]
MTVIVSTPSGSERLIEIQAARWRDNDIVARMWSKDPTVWADPPVPEIANRLNWLDAPSTSRSLTAEIEELHAAAVAEDIETIVLCGMGGSSLAPEVFAATLVPTEGSPTLTVIDSTHPDAVEAVQAATNPVTTWYVIASKSGRTIETMSLYRFFWDRAASVLTDPGSHFIAITDPGTSLDTLAHDRDFRATILADPDVGGRYSALTAFGLVPAGLTGTDLPALLHAGREGAAMCGPEQPLEMNPGFTIGVLLGERAISGVDKAQFVTSGPVETIGIWIEQLIAESTGKQGVGIIPIDRGPLLNGSPGATIIRIGHDTTGEGNVTITVDDPYDVAAVMFILEFATSVAGEILGINPFDQPNVEMAKKLAKEAMEGGIASPEVAPIDVEDPAWIEALTALFGSTEPSYVSIQAYVPQDPDTDSLLETLRGVFSRFLAVYTTTGFGPRFLHSTGQLHKGGPAGGVFLQVVDDTGTTLRVPETAYSFNELIEAQALGDRAALAASKRGVVAVSLGADRKSGLQSMIEQVERAFS